MIICASCPWGWVIKLSSYIKHDITSLSLQHLDLDFKFAKRIRSKHMYSTASIYWCQRCLVTSSLIDWCLTGTWGHESPRHSTQDSSRLRSRDMELALMLEPAFTAYPLPLSRNMYGSKGP